MRRRRSYQQMTAIQTGALLHTLRRCVRLHPHQQSSLQRKSVALHPLPPLAASARNQSVTTKRRLPRSRATKARSSGLWLQLPPLTLPWLSETGDVVGATSTGESCSCSCEGHRRAHRSETAVLSTSLRLRYAWLLLQWVSNTLVQIAANAHVSSRSTLGGR